MNNFEKLLDNGAFENMDKKIEESDKRYVEMMKTGLIDYNLHDIERLKNKNKLNDDEVLLYSTIEMSVIFGDLSNELVDILNSKKNVKTMDDYKNIVRKYERAQEQLKNKLLKYINLNDFGFWIEEC